MIISEWLPNPTGNDSGFEWIEFENPTTNTSSLDGFRLTSGKKEKTLKDVVVGPGERVQVFAKQIGLDFGNENGTLSLVSPSGETIQRVSFIGKAPEGLSFGLSNGSFSFNFPSPGIKNIIPEKPFPPPEHFDAPPATTRIFGVATLLSAILAVSVVALVIWSNATQKPLGKRDD